MYVYIDRQIHHFLYLSIFIDFLRYLVGRNIDIFLGGFNADGFQEVRSLNEIFRNYNIKFSEFTNLDGALFDHVYISKSFKN